MKNNKIFAFAVAAMAFGFQANAQLENNQKLFDPISDFRSTPYRSASGSPAEMYWQNRADYAINVDFDTKDHKIAGKVAVTYTNNSPDELGFLWLQLDQNKFKSDARGFATMSVANNRHDGNVTSGYAIKSIKVAGKDVKYVIEDTRLQVRLDEMPIKAKGGKVTVEIEYAFDIPEKGADRMGRKQFEQGWVYTIAQWFPRMYVYDDIKGWNTEPYLGAGEFYLEYGDIDYKITTDPKVVLIGSGELVNAKDTYTAEQLTRWEKAKNSDQTVEIISAGEVGKENSRPKTAKITWNYKIQNTRDAAFGASTGFIVDAAKINLPSGKKCLAISTYPKESAGKDGWGRSTEYTKGAIEHYSKMWFEFPYPTAVNVAGIVGGMEYPGVSFCNWADKNEELWGVTDHEFGHNWFPMIVGSNERLYPWMDEGFNTFVNHYSTKNFNKGEFAGSNMLQNGQDPRIKTYIFGSNRESIATYPDIVQDRTLGSTAYYKPGMGLFLLREYILGPDRFDYAFRTYIKRWAFKHPTPMDFFNTMENVAGEELDWFWRGWFYGNGVLDQAIEGVAYNENDPKKGAVVTVVNKKDILLPVLLEIKEENGNKFRLKLPVEIWQKGNRKDFKVATTSKIISIILDPDKILPDVDTSNDSYTGK